MGINSFWAKKCYFRQMNYLSTMNYWVREARSARLDPDQVASQNYHLPLQIHREVRHAQIGFLHQAIARLPHPPRVLDLGCGPGTWAVALAGRCQSWFGIDAAPEFIEQARLQAQERRLSEFCFEVGNLTEFRTCSGLPTHKFDVVVLGGVLGYLEDKTLEILLRSVGEVLAEGGLIYVRVSISPGLYPELALTGDYSITYRKLSAYRQLFARLGFKFQVERDFAFTRAQLATAYTFLARRLGRTGMTAYRMAHSLPFLSFTLARWLLDLTPLPQSMQFLLRNERSEPATRFLSS